MTDNVTYSVIKSPAEPQAQKDDRRQQKASSSRSPRSYHVTIALGLLSIILASMLLLQWILYRVEKRSWNSSLEFCLAKDANLFMCKDQKEMIQLQIFLSQEYYWIGLRNSSGWRWEDGSALNTSRIASNSLVQKCGTIGKGGLQASSCEVQLPWVCKKVQEPCWRRDKEVLSYMERGATPEVQESQWNLRINPVPAPISLQFHERTVAGPSEEPPEEAQSIHETVKYNKIVAF
ncbi:killer cell lectin-like receptor subfamily G member 1 isoform X2 [Odocoileus virginianus]|uniref:Killer cell lectin-like receptor subfamily G member 1 isoform X2 n=1 Tax=Odocoileus virginianus TaxID=9874 RepID=A0A6J0YF59_ODOVR